MAESLSTTKKKRTFRRGRLTTLKRQLDEVMEQDLRELDPSTLDTLKISFEEEIGIHQTLQDRYEALLADKEADTNDDGSFARELESGVEHSTLYKSYIISITNLIFDQELFKEATRLESAYEEWAKTAEPSARTFLEESKEFIRRCERYLVKSDRRASTELTALCRERIQSLIGNLHAKVHEVKERDEPPKPSDVIPSPAPYDRQTRFDIELPHFNGDPTEWHQFYNLFTSTIEKRGKHLTKEERCCLLIKSLKDPQAKRLAQLNTDDPDGYNEAISALTERYGQNHVLLPLHVKKIKASKTFSFSREGMLQAGELFVQTCRSLENMEVSLSNFLAAYAASHFDSKLTEEWTKHTALMTTLPTCKDLNKYLQAMVSRMPADSAQISSTLNRLSVKPNSVKGKTEAKEKPSLCVLCNDSIHSLTKCPIFKDYSAEKRSKVIKEKRWCTNCLHPSHQNQHCTSTYNCRHCNGRHHTMLHRGDTASSPTTSTSTASQFVNVADKQTAVTGCEENKPPPHAFLNTALVHISNGGRYRTSRVALDSGSSSSLITESLASQLKLKRHPQQLSLVGAYSEGTSKHYVEATLRSLHDPDEEYTLKLSVVSKLPTATPPSRASQIISDENIRDLPLADKQLGGRFDILLGSMDVVKCSRGEHRYFTVPDFAATPTIFGWIITGFLDQGQSSKFLSIQTRSDDLQQSLERIWELDQVPSTIIHPTDENSALEQFENTYTRDETGRYSVALPRIDSPPQLGNSKSSATSRFFQNEKSLIRKDRLADFNTSLSEYTALNHAELVPSPELGLPSYYLPVHGVFKQTSTTTKVRPVFDASAKSSNGIALNDLLLAGPSLYPLLTDVLIQFRLHRIGFTADISKMFREILLHPSERDLHRFLARDSNGVVRDHRMKRLTFGVKSSPFLATKVLQNLAEQNTSTHPTASQAILSSFYVDDFLSGADTLQQAIHIREELCKLLSTAGMTLRKWRTSCKEFAETIPEHLLERTEFEISQTPKALGIHWDVNTDSLSVSTPDLATSKPTTKRLIASHSARVYDILGLFAPFTVRSKLLLQQLWKSGCDWDEQVTPEIEQLWQSWVEELPLIRSHHLQRRYDCNNSDIIQRSLHGFSDASTTAYGAVVYLRQQHADGTIHTAIVISKARVSPIKPITIPRAELVAAHLLAKLLVYSAKLLDIPFNQIHAWTDSTILLCWLRKAPSSLQTFVANRRAHIQTSLPDVPWRHVPTAENPADLLSRGTSASNLISCVQWWEGPPWISQTPTHWTKQDHLCSVLPKQIPEVKAVTLTSLPLSTTPEFSLWTDYSSFFKLTRTLAWIQRFIANLKLPPENRTLSTYLLPSEMKQAKLQVLLRSQGETFPEIPSLVKSRKTYLHHIPWLDSTFTLTRTD